MIANHFGGMWTSDKLDALRLATALALSAILPALAETTCYEVFSPNGQLVYRSDRTPVDLSMPLSQGLSAVGLHGHHLTFYTTDSCIDVMQTATPSPPAGKPVPVVHRAPLVMQLAEPVAAVNQSLSGLDARHDYGLSGTNSGTGYRLTDRAIHIGPRGGMYVTSDSGNKQYVPRGRR